MAKNSALVAVPLGLKVPSSNHLTMELLANLIISVFANESFISLKSVMAAYDA
jgi:hypothetical protein